MSGTWIARIVLALLIAIGMTAAPGVAAPPGLITTHTLPDATSRPIDIAAGADGNIWFTENGASTIGRMTPAGDLTEFPIPTTGSEPFGITAGPDGNLWFTEYHASKIGSITPLGVITEYPLPQAGSGPASITAGPDGNLWFTEYNGHRIGTITPQGDITEYQLVAPALPQGIAAGPDGNLWFTANNTIGRITVHGTVTNFDLADTGTVPLDIASGPDGNLWFITYQSGSIGRITTAGTITEKALPGTYPYGIATGPDGNLWFTQSGTSSIGRITPDGTVTDFALPVAAGDPYGIAAGPDGSMWFTELTAGRIGRITTGISSADRKPTLNGSGQIGLPMVCGADVWGPRSSVTVGWQRDDSAIVGQAGLVYTPVTGDLGSIITCSSTAALPGMLTSLTAMSNGIRVVEQLTGPPGDPGAQGPIGPPGVQGPPGPGGTLSVVLAPGAKTVRAGKTLKVQFGVTNAASLTAQLKGKKTLTKQVQAQAGTNTLKMKVPKSVKPGKYTLRLLFNASTIAKSTVRVTK